MVILYNREGKISPNASLNIHRSVWNIDLERCWAAMNDPSQIIQAGCTSGAGTEVYVSFSLSRFYLYFLAKTLMNRKPLPANKSLQTVPKSNFIYLFWLPYRGRFKPKSRSQTRASAHFPARALPASDSHGPMIDCSLSAFVLGNCFVLLTVCLCSRPDSRDSVPPFFTYLPNIFKTVLKWITAEHAEVEGHRNVPACSKRGGRD